MNTSYAWSAGDARPQVPVASGACDCHIHVYDGRYPVAAGTALTPPDATVDDYLRLQARLGLSRVVLVTPSTYGADNRCMLEGLAQFAARGRDARGVAVISGKETDAQLQALHDAGVRGVRINLSLPGPHTLQSIAPIAHRIAHWGWHLQLLMPVDQWASAGTMLSDLPVELVLDHYARIEPSTYGSSAVHAQVTALMEQGRAWIKLSGAYLMSADTTVFDGLARSLIACAPDRVLWGSNWPHPTATSGRHVLPDDAQQLDALARQAGDAGLLRQILVTNPARLYGFPAAPQP